MSSRELRNLIFLPTLCFTFAVLALELGGLDIAFADTLFRWEGGHWQLQDAWITSDLIHDRGRDLVGLIFTGVLVLLASTFSIKRLEIYRRGLLCVLTSALISVAIVNAMKATTQLDCPWDIERYGGLKVYASLFMRKPSDQEFGQCFPAGHASGAYCWLGFFFLARHFRSQWKYRVLGMVCGLGVVFGAAQQLRGAHFLSHDVWTIYICWMSATLCYFYLFRMPRFESHTHGDVPAPMDAPTHPHDPTSAG